MHSVCFLNANNKNKKLGKFEGWVNFLTPADCQYTFEEMKHRPQCGIVVGELGPCVAPAFEASLEDIKQTKKPKKDINFTKNVFADKYVKPL